ncbi:MAG: hypothetical protein KGK11_00895 [Sphingomonadales bacterium]|nr:hypothetical protein [Sphingomonadales bacterium]
MNMSDLARLRGRAGGFRADARFSAAAAAPTASALAPDPMVAAHAAGFAEGMAAARAEAEAQAARAEAGRETLRLGFSRLDAALTETLRQRLATAVTALCEATLAPLALDPEALARRVERAAALFQRADDERVIRLNPEDLTLVGKLLPEGWHFVADPALQRGALRVETVHGGAEDGPDQWRQALAEAIGAC